MASLIKTWSWGLFCNSVAVSLDGARVAIAMTGKFTIWDVNTGEIVVGYTKHGFNNIVFSPDTRVIAGDQFDNSVIVCDTENGIAVTETVEKHAGIVTSLAFTPDSTYIASGSRDETIRLWDARTGQSAATHIHAGTRVNSVAVSPDGSMIAAACEDSTVKTYDLATGHMLFECLGHIYGVNVVVFSPDGQRIVSGSDDSDIRIWDRATGNAIVNAVGPDYGHVTAIAFTHDSRYFITSTRHGVMVIWDAHTGTLFNDGTEHPDKRVTAIAFTPDGTRFISVSQNEYFRVWDARGLGMNTGPVREDVAAKTPPPTTFAKYEITGATTAIEIVKQLGARGCADLTDELDLSTFSERPVLSGGFGDIYHCKLKNGIEVAVKTVRLYASSREQDQKHLKHIARELYTWSKCQHPNIQRLIGLVMLNEQIGMVTTWEKNGSMPQYLDQHPNVDRCVMSAQIATGLSYLHSCGVVHGDLKGANVLISDSGVPRLADFGNAKLEEYSLKFTKSSTREVLSSRWAAPELFTGLSCSTATDIYALGMTILETITGDIPWIGKSEHAVMFSVTITKASPERPEAYIPTYSEQGDALWRLLNSCWEFEPEKRPSAEEVRTIMMGIRRDGLRSGDIEMADVDMS